MDETFSAAIIFGGPIFGQVMEQAANTLANLITSSQLQQMPKSNNYLGIYPRYTGLTNFSPLFVATFL